MKYIERDAAMRAVLKYGSQAAVAEIQDLPTVDLDELRNMAEHYKQAYKLAYKLYQETRDGKQTKV